MKIQKLKGLAYDSESGLIGVIVGVNHVEEVVEIMTEEGNELIKIDNATFLEELGELDGQTVFNHDILTVKEKYEKGNEDKLWEIAIEEDGKLVLHLLEIQGTELKRKASGTPFSKSDLKNLEKTFEVVANLYEIEIEEEETVDFNIVIVRRNVGTHLEYLYACNNKEKEEVDLIKVVFIGATLLEEEDYTRETVTYEEYLELVEGGTLKTASPQELYNYATGVTHGQNKPVVGKSVFDSLDEEDDEDFDNYCADCGENHFDCDCE